ncbi:MAG: sugar phosphate isomerase/epimerase, partial [Alphaproteobacteria bacterium]|nr:sugar phosphate isomerase/epimerase [Alphaproteobacteria bacterium]
MPDISRLSINQATTRAQWSLPEAIRGYAGAGVHAIAVWRDKLAECGITRAAALLAEHQMTV